MDMAIGRWLPSLYVRVSTTWVSVKISGEKDSPQRKGHFHNPQGLRENLHPVKPNLLFFVEGRWNVGL
jgi:hypothetical protein